MMRDRSADAHEDERRGAPALRRHIHRVEHLVDRERRAQRNGHYGGVVWLTGLSGAGKSTLAMRLEAALFQRGWCAYALDADNVREGVCAGLGFSAEDRRENVRRLGELAGLFADSGAIAIVAAISPFGADRARARGVVGDAFLEVFVDSPLAICERRDPKGLYRKARACEILEFTGVSAPYEAPASPDLTLNTERCAPEESAELLVERVCDKYRFRRARSAEPALPPAKSGRG